MSLKARVARLENQNRPVEKVPLWLIVNHDGLTLGGRQITVDEARRLYRDEGVAVRFMQIVWPDGPCPEGGRSTPEIGLLVDGAARNATLRHLIDEITA